MKIADMPAGQQLDALVAEKVMGWRWYPCALNDAQKILAPSREASDTVRIGQGVMGLVPDFSTDIAAAWPVLEKLAEQGLRVELHDCRPDEGAQSWRVLFSGADTRTVAYAYASTPMLAICRAALLAVGLTEVPYVAP